MTKLIADPRPLPAMGSSPCSRRSPFCPKVRFGMLAILQMYHMTIKPTA